MIQRGAAEIPTMRATFQMKGGDKTKLRSTIVRGDQQQAEEGGELELTEVFGEESNRNNVKCEGKDLTDDHEHVPSCDLDGDHDEFVEDESGERNRDDVEEL